jgi:hypothetical protein
MVFSAFAWFSGIGRRPARMTRRTRSQRYLAG